MLFSPRSLLHGNHDHDSEAEGEYVMPVIGIFVILFLGLSGSLIPPLLGLYLPKLDINSRLTFRFFNGLAAGIVLGVAYCHAIPDTMGSFEEAFEGKSGTHYEYAWGGLIAMVGSLLTFICEEFVHRKIGRFAAIHGHSHDDHDHSHNDAKAIEEGSSKPDGDVSNVMVAQKDEEIDAATQAGYYTELYVLLFGLSFHSLFVGIALGVSGDDWGLFAAIVFHQFFEGLALGARVARAGFKKKIHIWILDIIYAVAIPVGIAIGIGIQSALLHNPDSYLIVNGVFQGLSAGVLIYVSLIHMMKEEMARPEFKKGGALLYVMYIGFFIGAGCMAVIGIWA